ncbi:MAG: hypothetical protein ACOX2K_03350 [Bacillota bacterium]
MLVVPASALQGQPTGVVRAFDLDTLLEQSCYLPRWQVEHNPKWRQLVSYIVLQQQNLVFVTQRLRAQGEARLHSLYSVGVGGHINRHDGADPVSRGWQRELAEEMSLDWTVPPSPPRALINDLSTDVSKDHLGLLFLVEIPQGKSARVREQDKMRGELLPVDEVCCQLYDRLESWSQLVVDYLREAQQ